MHDVPVQDAGIVVAVPARARVPEEFRGDVPFVASAEEVGGDIQRRLRFDKGCRRVGRRASDRELEAGCDLEEAVIRRVGANDVRLELEAGILPHMPQLVGESPRLGGRIAGREDEAEIRAVGPAQLRRFLRFVLRPHVLEPGPKPGDKAHRHHRSLPPRHSVPPVSRLVTVCGVRERLTARSAEDSCARAATLAKNTPKVRGLRDSCRRRVNNALRNATRSACDPIPPERAAFLATTLTSNDGLAPGRGDHR